ncbi:Putative F-box/FBD/LRR-repeat protein At3g49040 [Linum grandiflorum]
MENRPRKKRRVGKIDRLSNLPEAVIHHILSFLDIRSAVQTSVLSRQWRCAWKHLSVLDFSSLFGYNKSFRKEVEKVLSLRHRLNLSKVVFNEYLEELDAEPDNNMFARVSRYALSHRTRDLEINLAYNGDLSRHASLGDHLLGFNYVNFSLKNLTLSGLSFDSRFRWSSFRALEKLDMFGCTFSAGEDEVIIDPFRNLPCLKHLKLSPYNKCSNDDTIFRISGPQLLSLRVSYNDFRKMAIHAPKLKDLTIQYDYTNCHVEFTELNLPSVDHANVLVRFLDDVYNEGEHNECIKQQIIPLFVGLKNATSLGLSSFTARLLGDISDYLEEQPSPFTRLKSLILESMRDGVPFAVVNHLLKGSSAMKPVVKFTSQL